MDGGMLRYCFAIVSVAVTASINAMGQDGNYYEPDHYVTKFCTEIIIKRDYQPLRTSEALDVCYDYVFIEQERVDMVLFAMCKADATRSRKEAQEGLNRLFPNPKYRPKLGKRFTCVPKKKDGTRVLKLEKSTIDALKNAPWSKWPVRKAYRSEVGN